MFGKDFVNVKSKILFYMEAQRWCDQEKVLFASIVDFKLQKKDSYRVGYIMITNGANYIFKSKSFNSFEQVKKFSILNVNSIHFDDENITFEMDNDNSIQLRTENSKKIAFSSLFLIKIVTKNVKTINNKVHIFELSGSNWNSVEKDVVNKLNSDEHFNDILKWRAILFAHYYDIQGENLSVIDYFNKYEKSLQSSSMIVIGPSLHPGYYSRAFGHSIAWDDRISTVVFQSFTPSKFRDFFDSLIFNSFTIKKIVFSDYQTFDKIPKFKINQLESGSKPVYENEFFRSTNDISVLECFQFIRCIPDVIFSFISNIITFSISRIDSLIFQEIALSKEDFTHISELMQNNTLITKTTKHIEFSKLKIIQHSKALLRTKTTKMHINVARSNLSKINILDKGMKIKFNDISNIVSALTALETISIRSINGDANKFLRAICKSATVDPCIPIRSIHLNWMNFKKSYSELIDFPKTLIHLDISFSAFNPEAYVFLLKSLTKNDLNNYGIILESISISVNFIQLFDLIGKMNFNECHSTIAELDLSANDFSAIQGQNNEYQLLGKLFSFLATQKNLRLLSFNSITYRIPSNFLKQLSSFILSMHLPGLHLSFQKTIKNTDSLEQFETDHIYYTFLNQLSTNNISFLKTLSLKNLKCDNDVILELICLIRQAKQLVEIAVDGLMPNNQDLFMQLWKVVISQRTIMACEYPENDIKYLRIIESNLNLNEKHIIDTIKGKEKMSSVGKRYSYILANNQTSNFNDIFRRSIDFNHEEPMCNFANRKMNLYFSNDEQ